MQIGALGDIHGEFDTVHLIMQRHADVPLWVCVGDVASNDGEYFAPQAPLYFIKGNNEDFDVLALAVRGQPPAPTLHYMPNGGPHIVGPWRVAALGGTFAPSWYNTAASALPPSKGRKMSAGSLKLGKSRDDKRRHFVRDEVLACKALSKIDLFLTHEAPRPFYPQGRRIDAGQDGAQRRAGGDEAAAAPVRPPPRVHRHRAAGRPLDRPRHRDQVVSARRRRDVQDGAARHIMVIRSSLVIWLDCRLNDQMTR